MPVENSDFIRMGDIPVATCCDILQKLGIPLNVDNVEAILRLNRKNYPYLNERKLLNYREATGMGIIEYSELMGKINNEINKMIKNLEVNLPERNIFLL